MTAADPAPTPDRDRSTPPGHPASSDDLLSAGDVLSGRSRRAGGTLGADDDDHDHDHEEEASPVGHLDTAQRPAEPPPADAAIEAEDLDAETIVEDAIEYFTATGEADSPADDSDSPAPG